MTPLAGARAAGSSSPNDARDGQRNARRGGRHAGRYIACMALVAAASRRTRSRRGARGLHRQGRRRRRWSRRSRRASRAGRAAADAERELPFQLSAGAVCAEGAGQRDAAPSHRHARAGAARTRRRDRELERLSGARFRGGEGLAGAAVRAGEAARASHWRSRCCSPSISAIRRRAPLPGDTVLQRDETSRQPVHDERHSRPPRPRPDAVARNRTPYDSVLDTIGWTPLIRLNRVTRGIRTPVYAKAEFFNPGRLGEGPHRAADHRAGGARGAAQAGRDDRRGDERQHRRRARDRGGAQGLPVHLHDARQDVAGEGAAAEGVRRRGDHHADGGAAGPSGQLRDDGEAHRAARRRTRSSPTSSTTRRTPRRTTRRRAPSCGSRPRGASRTSSPRRERAARSPASGATSRRRTRRSRSSPAIRRARSSPSTWRSKGANKVGGRAVQGGGDRAGQDAGHARHVASIDEFQHGERQRRVRDGAAPHARGRAVRRRLGGLITHVALQVARERRRSGRARRDVPVRHGRALPLEAVQRRVDAREPDARAGPRRRSATLLEHEGRRRAARS